MHPWSPILSPHPYITPTKENKKKNRASKQTKKRTITTPPKPSLFLLSPPLQPFCLISFTINVPCNETLVWFKVSGFRYTIITGSSGTPLGYPVASRGPGLLVPQDQALHELQRILDGVHIRVGHPKARLRVWVVAKLVSSDHWDHLPQVREQSQLPYILPFSVSSPLPVVRGGAICGKGWGHLSQVQGPALL